MNKSEKEKLKKVFNIPEPQKKKQFIQEYNDLFKKNERRLKFPIIMRYSAVTVFAVLMIAVVKYTDISPDFAEKFIANNDSMIVDTTEPFSEPEIVVTSSSSSNSDPTDETETTVASTAATDVSVTTKSENKPDKNSVGADTDEEKPTENDSPEDENKDVQVTVSASAGTTAKTTKTTTVSVRTTAKTIRTTTHVRTTAKTTKTTVLVRTTTKPIKTTISATTVTEFSPAPLITTSKPHNNEPSTPDPPTCVVPPDEDITNIIPDQYNISGNIINYEDFFENGSDYIPPSSDNEIDLDALVDYSDHIIFADVSELIYTKIDDSPFSVVFSNSIYDIKNELNFINALTFVPGGYLPITDFKDEIPIDNYPEDTMVKISEKTTEELQKNKNYIFFTKDASGSFPSGSFSLTSNSYESIFAFDGEKYVSLGNPDISFTLRQLQQMT